MYIRLSKSNNYLQVVNFINVVKTDGDIRYNNNNGCREYNIVYSHTEFKDVKDLVAKFTNNYRFIDWVNKFEGQVEEAIRSNEKIDTNSLKINYSLKLKPASGSVFNFSIYKKTGVLGLNNIMSAKIIPDLQNIGLEYRFGKSGETKINPINRVNRFREITLNYLSGKKL